MSIKDEILALEATWGVAPLEAASAGVYIHGLLGDMLLEERGYFGFLAGELADRIPEAMARVVLD